MSSNVTSERGEDPYAGRTPTSHERRSGRPWDDSYRGGSPPWDIGRPQPAIVRLADQGAFSGAVLDAGCGTGEHALDLAARGYETLGVDVSPIAIEQARKKAAARQLAARFLVADALYLGRLGRTFDRVLDVGLFHSFDDAERRAYVDSLASATAAGSVLHLLCFSDAAPGNAGPRRVSQAELRAAFGTGWNVVSIDPERIEIRFDIEPRLDGDSVPAWLARIERT